MILCTSFIVEDSKEVQNIFNVTFILIVNKILGEKQTRWNYYKGPVSPFFAEDKDISEVSCKARKF